MNRMRCFIIFLLGVICLKNSFAQTPSVELRGAWIATVANIDWPSSTQLKAKMQKKEIIEALDFYQDHNFNTVFLQVRPSSGTFYPSKLEPWSRYLTGEQGKRPGYNPLKIWIKEAHKRNIEIHAWINPYRITNSPTQQLHKNHPVLLHPEWIINYGGKKYFNPGIKECKNHIINIVQEIVSNYQVDGIHFDDYFYPYPIAGKAFPDSVTYMPSQNQFPDIGDWRRNNVNKTIKDLNLAIKKINPNIKFGISPFGVWRNQSSDERGSLTNAGITNYDDLYADVLLWIEKGWIDYLTPQLYWSTENKAVPFEHLTQWWSDQACERSIFIGHALYKNNANKPEWQDASQLPLQIDIVRKTPKASGNVFFSHKHFSKNELGFTDTLKNHLYKYPALIPPMPWINNSAPKAPYELEIKKEQLRWKHEGSKTDDIKFAIYLIKQAGIRQLIKITQKNKIPILDIIANEKDIYGIQITALNHTNNESIGSEIMSLVLN